MDSASTGPEKANASTVEVGQFANMGVAGGSAPLVAAVAFVTTANVKADAECATNHFFVLTINSRTDARFVVWVRILPQQSMNPPSLLKNSRTLFKRRELP